MEKEFKQKQPLVSIKDPSPIIQKRKSRREEKNVYFVEIWFSHRLRK